MHISAAREKCLLIASVFGCFAVLLASSVITQTRFSRAQQARIDALEDRIFERMDAQAAAFVEQERLIAGDIESALGQRIADTEAALGKMVSDGTTATGRRVARIDAVYSGLLAEQRKRTLDSLYGETEMADKEREAAGLFRAGRHAAAAALYAVVAEARPENSEARFYHLYSLFLSNKLDRGNYRRIREGMLSLERNGYQRTEIRGVLDYIAAEETAAAVPEAAK